MRRVLVFTWALGTVGGVLLGLFGVQLVSSGFSSARVSPMSHPEVLRALQAARSVPVAALDEVASPVPPAPQPPPPPTGSAPAGPSAGTVPTPAPSSPARSLPRPGTLSGPLVEAAAAPASSSTTTTTALPAPVEPPTTTTTRRSPEGKAKPDSKKSDRSTTTTTVGTSSPAKPAHSSGDRTETFRTMGGVVTITWNGDKVSAMARPEAGWNMYRSPDDNGPDEISVWFWKRGSVINVSATADGEAQVQECQRDDDWHCERRKTD